MLVSRKCAPSEWQVVARHFFPENEAGKHTFLQLHFLHHLDILDAVPVIEENRLRFQFLSSCPAQFQILLFLVYAQEAAAQQIGSDAGGTAGRRHTSVICLSSFSFFINW